MTSQIELSARTVQYEDSRGRGRPTDWGPAAW
jgi:hypothetical protein